MITCVLQMKSSLAVPEDMKIVPEFFQNKIMFLPCDHKKIFRIILLYFQFLIITCQQFFPLNYNDLQAMPYRKDRTIPRSQYVGT